MRRFVVMIMIGLMSLLFACSQKEVEEHAIINFLIGEVLLNNRPVQIGQVIQENDSITTGRDSSCDIRIGESVIRIKEESELVFATLVKGSESETTVLGIDSGVMLCKPKKLLRDDSFIIKTPTAVAGVRGTQFTIEADMAQSTRVKVYEGEVKVALRVKQFEEATDEILEAARSVSREQKVTVTAREVVEAEKKVEAFLQQERGGVLDQSTIAEVIAQTRDSITVKASDIRQFDVGDFMQDEEEEPVVVEEKPKAIVQQIKKVIQQEKEFSPIDGTLLITPLEVYYIRNGSIRWEGKVFDEPVEQDGKVYIASGEYVFCTDEQGSVLWRKHLINEGRLRLKDGAVLVQTKNEEYRLDAKTGDRL